ncbi:hypothetical protein [Nitrospirillum sp. BR 11163]|uniref:beta strand repeat-containing protein n=1 Tax=Nitrospirillum sp. BR 11163 TaxID=3104323 RepID=UPI002AFEC655|nr:hypothetical protein [Nitrospirillum sp. BR 11163]MEA1676995.1 hypothetical protein [Nitrospirillum sp. BR 11163]
MHTATPTRSKALLLGASVLALATSWQGPARADTVVTGNSGPVTITSGGLRNGGRITGNSYNAAVTASGSLGSIVNSGIINLSGSDYTVNYGTAIALHGSLDLFDNTGTVSSLIAATQATIGAFRNEAGGSLTAVAATGGSIGSFVNGGIIAPPPNSYAYPAAINLGAATIYGSNTTSVLPATIGTIDNQAGAVIRGGLAATAASIGTLNNAGVITGNVNLSGGSTYTGTSTSTYSGSNYSNYSYSNSGAVISTIGLLTNAAGATITNSLTANGASIGTLVNAGLIMGGVSLDTISTSTYTSSSNGSNSGTDYSYSSTNGAVTSTVGALINATGATIDGNVVAQGASIGTFSNAGLITGRIYLGAASVWSYSSSYSSSNPENNHSNSTYSSIASSIGLFSNAAGATIATGVNIGGTVGTLDNAGLIGSIDGGQYYYSGGLSFGSNSQVGVIVNEAGGASVAIRAWPWARPSARSATAA